LLYEGPGEGLTKLYVRGSIKSKSDQLQILGNNLTQRLKLGSSCHTVKKAWKALHFIMCILKKGNSSTKSLAYTTLVGLILEYGAACWDLYRERQIHTLERVQKKAAKFAYHTN